MKTEINPQTPGPLTVTKARHLDYVHTVKADRWGNTDPVCTAESDDARLLAAAYNAFDKAGRELGTDAAELAERIDIAGLVRQVGIVDLIKNKGLPY